MFQKRCRKRSESCKKKGSPPYELSVFFHPLVIFFHALFETFQKNSTTHNCPANCISIFRKAQLLLTLRDPTNYLILNQLRTLVSHELHPGSPTSHFFQSGGFPNHYFSRALSSSQRSYHFLNDGSKPGHSYLCI